MYPGGDLGSLCTALPPSLKIKDLAISPIGGSMTPLKFWGQA